MEDKDSLIVRLRQEIRSRDQDIQLAATYGKELLEDKKKLSTKVEELTSQKELLEQEIHSLQLKLETHIDAVKSQTSELEIQREQSENLDIRLQDSIKENEILHKKIENISKENHYLKKSQKDLEVENKSLIQDLQLLQKQVKNFEDQVEKSLCESECDDSQEIQAQLSTYMLNNKELQDALSKSQYELELARKNENHLLQMVHEFEETIKEKNSEISTYQAEIKKAKEEIEELQGEIEVFKFNQVDVNRQGNSVFAELDDRRKLVEREYKTLRKKYDQLKKCFDERMKELDGNRAQVFRLQRTVSKDYQDTYIDKLETYLSEVRRENYDLRLKLQEKRNAEVQPDFTERDEYDYLRVMLQQLQEKEKELQKEVVNLASKNMQDNDKLLETEHQLHKWKEYYFSAKEEIAPLKQKIKDLERGIMFEIPNEFKTVEPKIEYLEGFQPLTKNKENEMPNKSVLNETELTNKTSETKKAFDELRSRRLRNTRKGDDNCAHQ